MNFKGMLLKILDGVKKVYLWLFKFMLDKQTNKFYRFYVHMMTIFMLFVNPIVYIRNFIMLFTAEDIYFITERLGTVVFIFVGSIILACGIKFMMRYLV